MSWVIAISLLVISNISAWESSLPAMAFCNDRRDMVSSCCASATNACFSWNRTSNMWRRGATGLAPTANLRGRLLSRFQLHHSTTLPLASLPTHFFFKRSTAYNPVSVEKKWRQIWKGQEDNESGVQKEDAQPKVRKLLWAWFMLNLVLGEVLCALNVSLPLGSAAHGPRSRVHNQRLHCQIWENEGKGGTASHGLGRIWITCRERGHWEGYPAAYVDIREHWHNARADVKVGIKIWLEQGKQLMRLTYLVTMEQIY